MNAAASSPFSLLFRTDVRAGAVGFALAFALFLPRAMVGPLRHWDEAWYAQVSREMRAEGSLLTPRWNGEPWFHKPPLGFWATAAAQAAFGETEFAARLFSLLCGAALCGLLAAATAQRFGIEGGLVAALLLAAIPDFARYAARGQLDAPVALFLVAYLGSCWRGERQAGWYVAAGVPLGLAVLTKGAAAGLGVIVLLVHAAVKRDFGVFRSRAWWIGTGIAAAIALPWHVAMTAMYGERFLGEYGSRHFAQAFAHIYPEIEAASPPASYYAEHLLKAPWGWIVLATMAAGAWAAVRAKDPRMKFAGSWAAAIPLALSLARTKWSWYLVPAYPAVALLATLAIARRPDWRRSAVFGALGLALMTAAEPMWAPASKEGEQEIRALAERIRELTPEGGGIHVAQFGRVRKSVYPIATRYYLERPVHALHSPEELKRLVENATAPVRLLARKAVGEEVAAACAAAGAEARLLVAGETMEYLEIARKSETKTGFPSLPAALGVRDSEVRRGGRR